MKQLLLLMVLCLMPLTSFAAENQSAVKTSTDGGRYEIVQSEIVRSHFFKLDKYTGNVYQMVQKKDGSRTWKKMVVIGLGLDEIKENTINFQIFIGGIAASDCLMINIHSGNTYQLYKDKDDDTLFWGTIIE